MGVSRILVLAGTVLLFTSFLISLSVPSVYPETSANVVLPVSIATFGNAWDGNLTFGVSYTSSDVMFEGANVGYVVVMNASNGCVEYSRQSDQGYGVVKNIGLNTVMFQGEPIIGGASTAPVAETHFWNFITNTTVDFPNVDGHHDVEYNPVNNTFLTLNDYVRQVGDNFVLYDKIMLLNQSGYVLWTWDTYDHIPLSDTDPFNMTSVYDGVTVMDLTHANTLDWDYNNSIIYLNVRNTNTFYAINQTTGNLMWACGEFGNFTLLGDSGNPVTSLWYHSHDLKQVAPNVFSMFDNDFQNVTNPDNCKSRMIDVTLNMTNMTAWVSWGYTAPTNYWSQFFGGNLKLPNGDRIGDFGTPTHQFTQNQPWVGNDTGAVLVEVNQTGQVVRTFTFPAGWQIYRIDAITNLTPFSFQNMSSTVWPTPSLSPIPTATPTPLPTPSPTPTLTPSPSQTPSPTPTPTPSPSPSPTSTPCASSLTPLESASPLPISSVTPLLSTQAPTQPGQSSSFFANLNSLSGTLILEALLILTIMVLFAAVLFYRRQKGK